MNQDISFIKAPEIQLAPTVNMIKPPVHDVHFRSAQFPYKSIRELGVVSHLSQCNKLQTVQLGFNSQQEHWE